MDYIKPGTISYKAINTSGILEVSPLDLVTNKLNYTIYGDGHSHCVKVKIDSSN